MEEHELVAIAAEAEREIEKILRSVEFRTGRWIASISATTNPVRVVVALAGWGNWLGKK
jgi:hypothetical protein